MVEGQRVYSKLKYESGVHRVQRVPETEASGRVHTSAVTVAVLPEADEVEVVVDPKDIRIDTFCSSGPGRPIGQHDLLRRPHHAPADGAGGFLPGREVADQEPRQGYARPPLAPVRHRPAGAAEFDCGEPSQPGRFRRPQRKDPDLQFPAEPRDRSPHRADALQPRRCHRWGYRRRPRRFGNPFPGGEDSNRASHRPLPSPGARRFPDGKRRPTDMAIQAPQGPPTVGSVLQRAVHDLRQAGVESPRLTAELLVGHVLGWDRVRVLSHGEAPVDPEAADAIAALVRRRCGSVPLQHLTGRQEFYGLDFEVGPAVLIPRPETEILVEKAAKLSHSVAPGPVVFADVGTGSGCIAVCVAHAAPAARGWGVDISSAALAVAQSERRPARGWPGGSPSRAGTSWRVFRPGRCSTSCSATRPMFRGATRRACRGWSAIRNRTWPCSAGKRASKSTSGSSRRRRSD